MFWLGVVVTIVMIIVCVAQCILGEIRISECPTVTAVRQWKLASAASIITTLFGIFGIVLQIKPIEIGASGLIITQLVVDSYRMMKFESGAQNTCQESWGCMGMVVALWAIFLVGVRLFFLLTI